MLFKTKIRYDIIGFMMLLTLFLMTLIPGVLWWFHITIQPWIFPASIFISVSFFWRSTYKPIREILAYFLIIFLSLILSNIVLDVSEDGQAYHQPMVYALANGWNPIFDSHNSIIDEVWDMNIWIDHYMKGMEISAATIFSSTGSLEAGKAVNIILMFSTLFMTRHLLGHNSFFYFSKSKQIIYSILIALPIIFIYQGFTFCIDGYTYYLVLWILLLVFKLEINKNNTKESYAYIFIIIYMATSTKWNCLFWVCYFIASYGCLLLYRKRFHQIATIATISLFSILLALLSVSFNPIITNTIDHQAPTYPIGTEYANDVSKHAQPNFIKEKNRISQVIISLFSRPNDNAETSYQNPYIISYRLNIRSLYSTSKLGGAGFFFIEILLISIMVFIFSSTNSYKKIILSLSILFLFSLIILPFGSNYRYVPYISLLPLVLLLYSESASFTFKFAILMRKSCLLLLGANITIAFFFSSKYVYDVNLVQYKAMNLIKSSSSLQSYRTENWSFNYKVHGNTIIDKKIFLIDDKQFILLPSVYPKTLILKDLWEK